MKVSIKIGMTSVKMGDADVYCASFVDRLNSCFTAAGLGTDYVETMIEQYAIEKGMVWMKEEDYEKAIDEAQAKGYLNSFEDEVEEDEEEDEAEDDYEDDEDDYEDEASEEDVERAAWLLKHIKR